MDRYFLTTCDDRMHSRETPGRRGASGTEAAIGAALARCYVDGGRTAADAQANYALVAAGRRRALKLSRDKSNFCFR